MLPTSFRPHSLSCAAVSTSFSSVLTSPVARPSSCRGSMRRSAALYGSTATCFFLQRSTITSMTAGRQWTWTPSSHRGMTVFANRMLLESLFSNLVVNAVRHNRPGGEICVTLTSESLEVSNTVFPVGAYGHCFHDGDNAYERIWASQPVGRRRGLHRRDRDRVHEACQRQALVQRCPCRSGIRYSRD